MTLEEYFDQDQYWSGSGQEFLTISEMPFPHAYFAYNKLLENYGDLFIDTPLFKKFSDYLYPKIGVIIDLLKKNGAVSFAYFGHPEWARARLYRAAKKAGLKVKTRTHKKGAHHGWVIAEVKVQNTIRVKGREITV